MTLKVSDVTVQFAGVCALDDVTLQVHPGEILGLIGPNGAGKTTLFNCMSGLVAVGSGSVTLDSDDITWASPHRRARAGISRTFQTPRFDVDGSVLGALKLGAYPGFRQSLFAAVVGAGRTRRTEKRIEGEANELLRDLAICDDPNRAVRELSFGRIRLLEVGRALIGHPRFLLLDEPAAGIDDEERVVLAQAIERAADAGIGVLVVEHNVPFVTKLAHRLAVMLQGSVLMTGSAAEVTSDPRVVDAYLQGPQQ